MPESFELSLILAMFVLVALLSVAARKTGINSPVTMLAAGIAIAFVPNVPPITLDPDLVLLGLLPPLLYSSGVNMSWTGFRANLRPILSMAIGCVLFTALAVAAVAHFGLGLSWANGFVLGAIVSPPDAVAAIALLKRMGLPQRILTILEGESLVNDATALVALSFALQAVTASTFEPSLAFGKFAMIVVGEIGYGCAVAFVMLWLRHLVNEPRAEILLALATPYMTFWLPHVLGGSGVVATVAAGLYVSRNGRSFIRSSTRLQGYFIWDLINWCVEALTFLICGLQMRAVLSSLSGDRLSTLLWAGAVISVTVIVIRFLWVFPVTYLPRYVWPPLRKREPPPSWRPPFLVGFTGLRGAVSLAAALTIPLTAGGQLYPDRGIILFATMCVIVATLVGQGAALPAVVKWLGLGHVGAREAAANRRNESVARAKALDTVLARLEQMKSEAEIHSASYEALASFHSGRKAEFLSEVAEGETPQTAVETRALLLGLLEVERAAIERAFEEGRITDAARRRAEREFDLEEASLKTTVSA